MASYPTAVKTFTSKTPGQAIGSAHINDLQDEVNAIEAGILQGTAPITSSNITAAELFVTKEPPYVLARSGIATQVANNTSTSIGLEANHFISTSGLHSTTTNPHLLTPVSSGVYHIQAAVQWAAGSSAGAKILDILLNSTTILARSSPQLVSAAAFPQQTAVTWRLQTTDTIEMRVIQTSGSTASLELVGIIPYLSMVKVR